ncbi:aminopeptidase N [Pseudochrobactrum saccharolyticum]|uniref:Aminopeptidase N n=1 Tax=Pseudochrobactrum saccharolyticum TaxID=354352 RepID=A0A7W8EMT3_9HYPH|nr:aminopeptidase N [Pseudochrobactrum saccharolyticum]KAB0540032.1 aminopeptidase N [Pseudochrobactrum saccharolyticum]MBB5089504.1 aminopeptidase N [Pseudochrobactrum saccharolyticum]
MRTDTGHVFRLEDYRPSDYLIRKTELDFQLDPEKTIITARLTIERRDGVSLTAPLILDGDELELVSLQINDKPVSDYTATPELLTIRSLPQQSAFTLEIVTRINPTTNRQLMGLYRSSNVYTTQCEAEGFRRITYFPDRPDVLSVYTVRLEADKQAAPILLSNGNLEASGDLANGRHYALWHDPHPKPSYLFALVAGDLGSISDQFTTLNGRQVALNIYVEHGNEDRATYAMDALKRSMRWDEEVYGREYDLDIFNIVAVSDFNMGAMENKGLNIFNDKYVLADPQTATDTDYAGIEAVIAHEYFHNWTGNRITCRDWFQLCLKEGLTVYRDHEFSSDMRSRAVHRIDEVKILKAQQFPEDGGPLAHPVRPKEYREINNFYTATVYEKGSELIRMLRTIIGDESFYKGLDLYFSRHDGEAATIEDFIKCFEDVTGRSLTHFALWYDQAGTPLVTVSSDYDAASRSLRLTLGQKTDPTPGQSHKQPMHIPVKFGLIGADGKDIAVTSHEGAGLEGDILHLREASQSWTFHNIAEKPVLSLLRGFSAPVHLSQQLSREEQLFLARHDSDAFGRWQVIHQLMSTAIMSNVEKLRLQEPVAFDPALAELLAELVQDETLDHAFRALCLSLPEEADIARELGSNIDPDLIRSSREALLSVIAAQNAALFAKTYASLQDNAAFTPDAEGAGKRALKAVLLSYLAASDNDPARVYAQFNDADNMTDKIAALTLLVHRFYGHDNATQALAQFEKDYGNVPLAMDKWFGVQARRPAPDALETVQQLMQHPLFSLDNPNRTRALLGAFAAGNPTGFNRPDGKTYAFFTNLILTIDRENPQLASRLLTSLRSWKTLEPARRDHLKTALETIAQAENLSADVRDITERMLA